jgi:hypothetical protein
MPGVLLAPMLSLPLISPFRRFILAFHFRYQRKNIFCIGMHKLPALGKAQVFAVLFKQLKSDGFLKLIYLNRYRGLAEI